MKTTQSKEDYLKIIFKLNGYDNYVSNKLISQALNVSPPSVSHMLNKLDKEDMIEYVAYKGAKLTHLGRDIAIQVVRKHRLAENFLFNVLKYQLNEVDKDAELLEHIESEVFFERLDEFLNYPKYCPHGGIIPSIDNYRESQSKSLFDSAEQDTVIVRRIIDNKNVIMHLDLSDVRIGDTLKLTSFDRINEIVFFTKNGTSKYISFALAQMIFVEKIENHNI